VFASQSEAKRFFIDKITAQARAESKHLSESEEWMLGFSESDAEFSVDPIRVEAFGAEISPQQYEAKIAGLLRRRYRRDVERGVDTAVNYRDAYRRLQEGDHYLTVIIEQALGLELRSVPNSARLFEILAKVGPFLLLVLPGTVAMVMAAGLTFGLVAGQAESGSEAMALLVGVLFLTGCGYYLFRLWLKYRARNFAVHQAFAADSGRCDHEPPRLKRRP
jgi:hypothetical protein